jgi:peptidoglycan/xylan/chitin deacetylase (PgdA/CDA1 family)
VTPAALHNVTFHGVGNPRRRLGPGEARVWLSIDDFLATIDALRGRDDVRISFDDGNRSDVDVALPALAERGMTATFFALAGHLHEPLHLAAELAGSRRVLEAVTGRPITQVSVPFGSYDRRVLAQARRAGGYERVFTSDGGAARPSAWLQPRTTVSDGGLRAAELPARRPAAGAARRAAKRWVKRWR